MASTATDRFAAAATLVGITPEIVRFPKDTRTAVQAAEAVGCELGQIVKSLIFRAGGELVLVLTSGVNRVDEARVAPLFGAEVLERADPAGVREATGFAIGGVPPFGHPTPLPTVIDIALLEWQTVWAAAGAPDAVFEIESARLQELTGATAAQVAG